MMNNMWLDYVEDLWGACTFFLDSAGNSQPFPYMAYFCVLRDMKYNKMIILGRDEKLEML